jgi:hypothetical protein
MGKKDMSADVPGKTLVIHKGGGKAADVAVAFNEQPVVMTEIVETVGSAESARSGAKDEDFHSCCSLNFDRAKALRVSLRKVRYPQPVNEAQGTTESGDVLKNAPIRGNFWQNNRVTRAKKESGTA